MAIPSGIYALAATSSSPGVLSTAGNIASIAAAAGIVAAVVTWIWRWSRRHTFPNLTIEVWGLGHHTVEHVTTVPGASNSLTRAARLRRMQVIIVSRESRRNSALTFTLRFRGLDGDEVIWATPQWRVDPAAIDEHLTLLTPPVEVEREHAITGVFLFEPSPFPIDESIAPKVEVFDHVSRARVRIPGNTLGNYDRKTWQRPARNGRLARWHKRLVARDERYVAKRAR